MKKIGIIDADLISRKKHRFPNLASMKISGYHKSQGDKVILLLNYDDLEKYDKVYISKVFTDTYIDENILKLDNVEYGGTGFFYDKAPNLPYEIEHHMPDYSLYDDWVNDMLVKGTKRAELSYYLDYSIGFTTRGCFRKCMFCVNRNHTKVVKHSSVSEFLDENRKYICLLDDNILGYGKCSEIFEELNSTKKRFQYKQGMDERLLTDDKCKMIFDSNYKGDYIFAFDNIEDADIIKKKLKLWNKHKKDNKSNTKFYVFCGFDRNNVYDDDFWKQDLIDTFERIKILMEHGCIPYIMRHENYVNSPFKGTYITLASWCNQPSFFKKTSYREYCEVCQARVRTKKCAPMIYLEELQKAYPDIADMYFDMKFDVLKDTTIED